MTDLHLTSCSNLTSQSIWILIFRERKLKYSMILIAPEKSYDIVNVKKNSLQLIMANACGKYYVAETMEKSFVVIATKIQCL